MKEVLNKNVFLRYKKATFVHNCVNRLVPSFQVQMWKFAMLNIAVSIHFSPILFSMFSFSLYDTIYAGLMLFNPSILYIFLHCIQHTMCPYLSIPYPTHLTFCSDVSV